MIKKVQLSPYAMERHRPFKGLDRPVGVQNVEVPRMSRQSVQVVSPTYQPPLPRRR